MEPEDRWHSRVLRGARPWLAKARVQAAVAYVAVLGVYAGWFAPASGRDFVPQPAIAGAGLSGSSDSCRAPARQFANVDLVGLGLCHHGRDPFRGLSRRRGAVHAADQSDRGKLRQSRPARHARRHRFRRSRRQSRHPSLGGIGRQLRRSAWLACATTAAGRPATCPSTSCIRPTCCLKYPAMHTLGTSGSRHVIATRVVRHSRAALRTGRGRRAALCRRNARSSDRVGRTVRHDAGTQRPNRRDCAGR